MEITALKLIGVLTTIAVVANITLFAFRIISVTLFWVVIVIAAILAYVVIPMIKKQQKS